MSGWHTIERIDGKDLIYFMEDYDGRVNREVRVTVPDPENYQEGDVIALVVIKQPQDPDQPQEVSP